MRLCRRRRPGRCRCCRRPRTASGSSSSGAPARRTTRMPVTSALVGALQARWVFGSASFAEAVAVKPSTPASTALSTTYCAVCTLSWFPAASTAKNRRVNDVETPVTVTGLSPFCVVAPPAASWVGAGSTTDFEGCTMSGVVRPRPSRSPRRPHEHGRGLCPRMPGLCGCDVAPGCRATLQSTTVSTRSPAGTRRLVPHADCAHAATRLANSWNSAAGIAWSSFHTMLIGRLPSCETWCARPRNWNGASSVRRTKSQ